MTNWEEVRKQFPVLQKYIYLNAAGGSPMSSLSAAAGKKYFDEMLSEGDLPYENWIKRTEETRKKMAGLINASSDEIGFTMNTSSGMSIISRMLENQGDVLTMKDEFPSSTIPWINNGYKVLFIEPHQNTYPVEIIEKNISPGTRVLVTSYVQYRTGFRQDLKSVGEMCKKHKLIYVVNATQGIGVLPIDVKDAGIDFMAFSGLKWTTSGYGAGVIFISSEMLKSFNLPVAGWQSPVFPDEMDNSNFQLRKEASAVEAGCPHFPSVFALGGALDLINSIGVDNIHKRIISLNKLTQAKIEQLGLDLITPAGDNQRSGILIIKTRNAKSITNELARRKIIVSARGEGIRVSISFFNNESDIDAFSREVKHIIELF